MPEARNQSRREPVLDAVRERCDHPTADEIFADVRKHSPRVSRATVYRNLRTLSRDRDPDHPRRRRRRPF